MKNPNRPAFPLNGDGFQSKTKITELHEIVGISKREYFAAMAMQAIIPSYMNKPVSVDNVDEPVRLAAQWSLRFADELLKSLSNE